MRIGKRIDFDIRDAHAYSGLVLITSGTAIIYWPAALIVAGAILFYLAVRRP